MNWTPFLLDQDDLKGTCVSNEPVSYSVIVNEELDKLTLIVLFYLNV